LLKHQEENGSWLGRWGINYVYGTASAVCGLMRVGEKSSSRSIRLALGWLVKHQNSDGGFGESVDSYVDPSSAGRGLSTPSQTAWALSALVAGGMARSSSA